MTKTMCNVLKMLVAGEGCYILPATRRALKRHGYITYEDASSRTDRIVVTELGRAIVEGKK